LAKIREDLVGVVSVNGLNLSAGETVPDGVAVGDHVLAHEAPAKPVEVAQEPAQDEKPAPRRRTRKNEEG